VTASDQEALCCAYCTHITTVHPTNHIPDELLRMTLLPMVDNPEHAADGEPLTEREAGAS
jgi:hypothetical protein